VDARQRRAPSHRLPRWVACGGAAGPGGCRRRAARRWSGAPCARQTRSARAPAAAPARPCAGRGEARARPPGRRPPAAATGSPTRASPPPRRPATGARPRGCLRMRPAGRFGVCCRAVLPGKRGCLRRLQPCTRSPRSIHAKRHQGHQARHAASALFGHGGGVAEAHGRCAWPGTPPPMHLVAPSSLPRPGCGRAFSGERGQQLAPQRGRRAQAAHGRAGGRERGRVRRGHGAGIEAGRALELDARIRVALVLEHGLKGAEWQRHARRQAHPRRQAALAVMDRVRVCTPVPAGDPGGAAPAWWPRVRGDRRPWRSWIGLGYAHQCRLATLAERRQHGGLASGVIGGGGRHPLPSAVSWPRGRLQLE